jgi:hypothetical protein
MPADAASCRRTTIAPSISPPAAVVPENGVLPRPVFSIRIQRQRWRRQTAGAMCHRSQPRVTDEQSGSMWARAFRWCRAVERQDTCPHFKTESLLNGNGRMPGLPQHGRGPRLRSSTAVFSRRQMRSRQQEKSGEKGPEHQARRQSKRAVNLLKIQPGQGQYVGILQGLG